MKRNEHNYDLFTPQQLPDDLMNLPGFLGDALAWGMDAVPYPNRPLLFASALSAFGVMLSGKIHAGGIRPNLSILLVAPSCAGKTVALHWAQRMLRETGQEQVLCGGFASLAALDKHCANGATLWWSEEHLNLFHGARKNAALLKRYFELLNTNNADGYGNHLHFHAHWNTPDFLERISRDASFRRLVRQSLIFGAEVGKHIEYNADKPIPDKIQSMIEYWRDYRNKTEVAIDEAARMALERAPIGKTTRTNAIRLALLHAASTNPERPRIGQDAVSWAMAIIKHCECSCAGNP